MKKLLLFFIAVLAIVACTGRELSAYAADFGVTEYSSFETAEGEVEGETFTVNRGDFSEKEILYKLGALYHFEREVDGIVIIYGYSPKLKRITIVDKKPVNFQITVSGDTVTVSNPVNLGSF